MPDPAAQGAERCPTCESRIRQPTACEDAWHGEPFPTPREREMAAQGAEERFGLLHCPECGDDEPSKTDEKNVWKCERCGHTAAATDFIRDVVWATEYDALRARLEAVEGAAEAALTSLNQAAPLAERLPPGVVRGSVIWSRDKLRAVLNPTEQRGSDG